MDDDDEILKIKEELRSAISPTAWPSITKAEVMPQPQTFYSSYLLTADDASSISHSKFVNDWEATSRPGLLRNLFKKCDLTLESLLIKFSDISFCCGTDDEGEDIDIALKDMKRYMETNSDRNPFMIFDALTSPELSPLLDDYEVPNLFAHDDFLSFLGEVERPPYRWLIIAPERSASPLHQDPIGTHAFNFLVCGQKRWILFHPSIPENLLTDDDNSTTDDDDDWGDPFGWFSDEVQNKIRCRVKNFLETKSGKSVEENWWCIDFVQAENETVFVPSMWHHAVINLKDSVAITHNYCSRSNVTTCFRVANGFDLNGNYDESSCSLSIENAIQLQKCVLDYMRSEFSYTECALCAAMTSISLPQKYLDERMLSKTNEEKQIIE